MATRPAADPGPPLFCPFCEECFEGEARCPEHDIPLVPFEDLAAARGRDLPQDGDDVAGLDPRFGRLPLALGALTVLVGFFLPFLRTDFPDGTVSAGTGLETASNVALNLWIVPAVAGTLVSILVRRRSPMKMRGARLAVILLALVGASSLIYTVSRVYLGADRVHAAYGQSVEVTLQLGLYLMSAGLVIVVAAAPFFGRVRQTGPRYRVD